MTTGSSRERNANSVCVLWRVYAVINFRSSLALTGVCGFWAGYFWDDREWVSANANVVQLFGKYSNFGVYLSIGMHI